MNQSTAYPVLTAEKVYPQLVRAAASTKNHIAGLQIGDYLVGDEAFTNLFGHPDIRY